MNHDTGPLAAQRYHDAGFRVLRIDGELKSPITGGFGAAYPNFSHEPGEFAGTDRVALLCGPCPALGDDWLACFDLDHGMTIEDVETKVGPLPATLSSKGRAHFYFRVTPGPHRDALMQWTDALRTKTKKGDPALDLKWAGGYAIEPGSWDVPFSLDAIATLPAEAAEALVAIKGAGGKEARKVSDTRQPMGDLPEALLDALAERWPEPGDGCHEAALALGGILAGSFWAEGDIADFADGLWERTGTTDRTFQVLYSVDNRREDPTCAVKGWPSLKPLLLGSEDEVNQLVDRVRSEIPGLVPPKFDLKEIAKFQTKAEQKLQKVKVAREVAGQAAQSEGRRMLVYGSANEVADCIIAEHLTGCVYDDGEVWKADQLGVWRSVRTEALGSYVDEWDGVEYLNAEGKACRFLSGKGSTTSVLSKVEQKLTQPGFFKEAPIGVAFQNGFLDVKTRQLRPLADCRIRSVLPFDYKPDRAHTKPPIEWIKFIQSVWGPDTASIDLLHQIIGYLLSGRMDQEKIFLFIGPPRGGKGTVFKLLNRIFGDACVSFKVARMDKEFSLAGLLNSTVAIDPDVRRSTSAFKDEGATVERLLSISSGENQPVARKYATDVDTTLRCRLLMGANPPFGLRDVGGALSNRLIILTFPRSFLGKEDLGLAERLIAEIPSIVALALDGLDRLNVLGRFVEPDSSAAERASVEKAQSPMLAFWEDEIDDSDPEALSGCQDVFTAANAWREREGHKKMSSSAFSEFLRARGVVQVRPEKDGKKLPRCYKGIKLLPQASALSLVKG